MAATHNQKRITRGHSCLTCAERKVRCDGQRPCSTCQRSNIPCTSKPTQITKARSIKRPRFDTSENGNDAQAASDTAPGSPSIDGQHLTDDQGHSRYVESIMWLGVGRELPTPSGHSEPKTDNTTPGSLANTGPAFAERLLLGGSLVNLSSQHPSSVKIFYLWQTYLENVKQPVTILHIPTFQKMILNLTTTNEKDMPASLTALFFSLYLIAICSIPPSNHGDCERVMGQPINKSIDLYYGLAQQALINARFMQTPDFTTLQALLLFLISQRTRTDPQTLWQLTGVAIRTGQMLGLHREKALQDLTVFEAEMRRRLWWELVLLESFAAKQCGAVSVVVLRSFWDTKRPLNINDSDLHADMRNIPDEHQGFTEMSFSSARAEVGELTMAQSIFDGSPQTIADVDAKIEALRRSLHERLLKYCDPSIPDHFLLQLFVRGALARIGLTVRRRHIYARNPTGLSPYERDRTFSLCLQLTEVPNSFAGNQNMQKFLWQANAFFPLEALMFMLGEIAYRKDRLPPAIDRAWQEIEKAYECQPRLLHDDSNAIYSAVRNLTVKAWDRSMNGARSGQAMPHFVERLHAKLSKTNAIAENVQSPAIFTPLPFDKDGATTVEDTTFDFDASLINPESWSKISIPDDPDFWEYWQQFAADLPDLAID